MEARHILPLLTALLPLLFFLALLVFAILMLVDLASSQKKSKTAKIWWTVLILLFWPITGLAYAIMASKSKIYRYIGICLSVCFIFIGSQVFGMVRALLKMPHFETPTAAEHYKTIDKSELTDAQINQLYSAYDTMNDDSYMRHVNRENALQIYRINGINIALHAMLQELLTDNKLTSAEFNQWIETFKNRNTLDDAVIDKYRDPSTVFTKKEMAEIQKNFEARNHR